MIESAEADIICPAVAAEDPYGLLGKIFAVVNDILRGIAVELRSFRRDLLRSSAVLLAVVKGCKEFFRCSLEAFRSVFSAADCFDVAYETVADGLLAEVQAEAVLRVVLGS